MACSGLVAPAAIALERSDELVTIRGQNLADLAGRPISDLAVFRYDALTRTFVPIPFQVDERVDHVFNPDTTREIVESMYDVFREDGGRLDGDDELVFAFGDAGASAPPGASRPPGADPVRYAISATDVRPGVPATTRWAYVFTGPGLPRSSTRYVSWNATEAGSIRTGRFQLDYRGPWLLTGYRVLSPCGTGADLVDRLKGRSGRRTDLGETEELWNRTSTYLGGISGPVRAIRYVRGAASGFNTIHFDVVSPGSWTRRTNLRVHSLPNVWLYFDWLPRPGMRHITSTLRGGVTVDGLPDTSLGTSPVRWSVVRTPGGGMFASYDVPPSPFVQSSSFYYRDDRAYDDAPDTTELRPYTDDDNGAYGNHGMRLTGLTGTELDLIPSSFTMMPLCSSQGDAAAGDRLQSFLDAPLQLRVQAESVHLIRTLRARRDRGDVVLSWSGVTGATSYRVYAAAWPDLPHTSWTKLGETTSTSYRHVGGAAGEDRFYSVVAVTPTGEAPW